VPAFRITLARYGVPSKYSTPGRDDLADWVMDGRHLVV
jgi:hypothetical protein